MNCGSKVSIRGLHVNMKNHQLVITSHEDGYIYLYEILKPICADSRLVKRRVFRGFKNPRNAYIWNDRNELYIGHSTGVISVFKLDNDKSVEDPLSTSI